MRLSPHPAFQYSTSPIWFLRLKWGLGLPTELSQVLAWVKLLARVPQGDLQGEVGAIGSGNSVAQGAYWFATRVSKTQGVKLL